VARAPPGCCALCSGLCERWGQPVLAQHQERAARPRFDYWWVGHALASSGLLLHVWHCVWASACWPLRVAHCVYCEPVVLILVFGQPHSPRFLLLWLVTAMFVHSVVLGYPTLHPIDPPRCRRSLVHVCLPRRTSQALVLDSCAVLKRPACPRIVLEFCRQCGVVRTAAPEVLFVCFCFLFSPQFHHPELCRALCVRALRGSLCCLGFEL
jgi:hypothetical protein